MPKEQLPPTGPEDAESNPAEIWEMTLNQYLDSLNGHDEGERVIGNGGEGFEFDRAIAAEHWREVVGEKIKEDPNQVPEYIRLQYDGLFEKNPPKPETGTNLPPEVNLTDPKLQRAADLLIRGASKPKTGKTGELEREHVSINDPVLLARVMGIKPKEARELVEKLKLAGIISRDKKTGKLKPLWSNERLLENIAQTRGSRRAKESTLREALSRDDLVLKSVALLLGESRKGKPFSHKSVLARELNLKSGEVDEILARLAEDGLIEKTGRATILNPQAMADYLRDKLSEPGTDTGEPENADESPNPSETPPVEPGVSPAKLENPPSSVTPESVTGEEVLPEEMPAGIIRQDQTPEDATFEEVESSAKPAETIGTPSPPETETLQNSSENLSDYFKKVFRTIEVVQERKIRAGNQIFGLRLATPETDQSLTEIDLIVQAITEKSQEASKARNRIGERFDHSEISHAEFLAKTQKILDQAIQEINPLLVKTEEKIKAIEDKIDAAPKPEPETEPDPRVHDFTTHLKNRDKNLERLWPDRLKEWMRKHKKTLLVTLGLSIGAGLIGANFRKEISNAFEKSKKGDKKETVATQKEPEKTKPDQFVTAEIAALQKKNDSLAAEVARLRSDDSIQHPESLAPAQEPNFSKETQDKDVEEDGFTKAKKQMEEAKSHSQYVPPGTVPSTPQYQPERPQTETPSPTPTFDSSPETAPTPPGVREEAKPKTEEVQTRREGLTTERSSKLNQTLKKAGMNPAEWEEVKNMLTEQFLKKYGGINGILAIGDLYTDTRTAWHRAALAESIGKMSPQLMEEQMTLEEFFRWRESQGK